MEFRRGREKDLQSQPGQPNRADQANRFKKLWRGFQQRREAKRRQRNMGRTRKGQPGGGR